MQNQIIIAKDVKYITESKHVELSDGAINVSKLINGLIKSAESYNPHT